MLLRLLFFLEMWEKFLANARYNKSNHFISREFSDITHILIHGLIQLVIIYRDHLPEKYPLLP